MGILNNGFRDSYGTFRFAGAGTLSGAAPSALASAFHRPGAQRNRMYGEATNQLLSVPAGATHPVAWIMPQKSGAMSSHNEAQGSADATLAMASGWNLEGLAEGTTPTAQATLQLVVSMLASALGEATSSANLRAALLMAGTASGVATNNAVINALAWAIGNASGEATATLVRYATGQLQGSITPFTELSPEGLAGAVWSSLASQYNEAGTMGEKLNGAGSAGNPWAEIIEAGYSAADILRIVAASLAGEVSGAETTGITFKGLDGTTDRIQATVDTNGNRLSVTLDGN